MCKGNVIFWMGMLFLQFVHAIVILRLLLEDGQPGSGIFYPQTYRGMEPNFFSAVQF
jgi:hypothetical protein